MEHQSQPPINQQEAIWAPEASQPPQWPQYGVTWFLFLFLFYWDITVSTMCIWYDIVPYFEIIENKTNVNNLINNNNILRIILFPNSNPLLTIQIKIMMAMVIMTIIIISAIIGMIQAMRIIV